MFNILALRIYPVVGKWNLSKAELSSSLFIDISVALQMDDAT